MVGRDAIRHGLISTLLGGNPSQTSDPFVGSRQCKIALFLELCLVRQPAADVCV